ncbi:hypothetical protein C3L33_16014, partial [Rhododendron williamsianum]
MGYSLSTSSNTNSSIVLFQLISHENAKKELTNVDGLTVEKVDELVEEFLEDYKEDLDETKGWPANFAPYIVSKAALNGYTRVMARNYPHILINAVCPGYVKTDINYNSGILTVEQGAKGPVMLALVPGHGPSGLFYIKLVTEELIPLLQLSESPRIVNISATMGKLKLMSHENAKKELTNVDGLTVEKVDELVEEFLEDYKEDLVETKGWPANLAPYIVSKAALNGYTRVMARNYPHIPINAVCPGYVKTDLNYNSGILTVEQGAKGPVMLALVPGRGPSGLFYSQMEVSTF